MPPQPQSNYNPVPTVAADTTTGGDYLSVRASPESMGAQVGSALQKAGNTVGDLGNKAFDYARLQQGIANETAVTNADAAFAMKVGELKGNYMSLTGSAAYSAFPQYQQDVHAAFQEQRAVIPPGAQHSFDMLATRSMANHIADGSTYAASQLKEGLRDSYTSLANSQFLALLDPNVAADRERSQYHLDSLRYAADAQVDFEHPGLKTDPTTGKVNFDDSTVDGQNLKAGFQQRLDTYLTQGYVNRYDTLMKGNVFGAYEEYQQDRPGMPKGAQVMLDAKFGQKIFDKHAENATGDTIQEAFKDHWQTLTDPAQQRTSKISDAIFSQESGNKFADQVSTDGAIGGAQIMPATFAQYAKPGENINNPEDNKAVGQRIVEDYTKKYKGDAARVAVAYFSGPGNVAPEGSSTPWVKDTMDGNGKSVSSYVSDIADHVGNEPQKTYATGPTGSPMSSADYFLANRQNILQKGEEYANQLMPGDLALKRAVRQSLSNFMEATIQNQHAQYSLDNKNVMRGITGELTDGKAPMTEAELRQVPNMSAMLDRVAYQDPKFYETVPTLIAKTSSRYTTVNSPNAYETIMRTLQPNDGIHPNGIFSQDHLDRLLGRSDGNGINMKDYKDAKNSIDMPDKFKEFLTKNMQVITNANGNVDGQGQQRAVQYYNAAVELYQKKLQDGKVIPNMVNPQSSDYIDLHGAYMPSRAQQIQNAVKNPTQEASNSANGDTIAINPTTGAKVVLRNGTWQPM